MKNLRELFSLYHAGFQDFGPWLDHHREMHRRHPLGCAEFGAEWLQRWEAVGRLLRAPARIAEVSGGCIFFIKYKHHFNLRTVRQCLTYGITRREYHPSLPMRVSLLDGTIIREWGQQNEQQATLYIRGRYPAWRIDARGTVTEMLERGEKRSQAKGLVMYRYAVKVVDSDGGVIKQWDKNRP